MTEFTPGQAEVHWPGDLVPEEPPTVPIIPGRYGAPVDHRAALAVGRHRADPDTYRTRVSGLVVTAVAAAALSGVVGASWALSGVGGTHESSGRTSSWATPSPLVPRLRTTPSVRYTPAPTPGTVVPPLVLGRWEPPPVRRPTPASRTTARATARATATAPVSATRTATAPEVQLGVVPGAFCAPEGAVGRTVTGLPMECTRQGEDRARWRQAEIVMATAEPVATTTPDPVATTTPDPVATTTPDPVATMEPSSEPDCQVGP